MAVIEGPKSANIVSRVQGILLKPVAEWDVIDGESATVPGLFTGYACILAAIGPIAMIVGQLFFLHWTVIPIIGVAVVSYVASLIGVFIIGFIIDALAPSFDGQKNQVQAMKASVYAYTATWVAGILYIVPGLGFLAGLAGLYGLYLLWLGLPKMMKAPQEKAAGYFVVTLIAAILVYVIIGAVIGAVTLTLATSAIIAGAAHL